MAKQQSQYRMAEIDLQFPLRGIDETRSSTRQQEGTTYDSQNVRSFEPSTGRARGSQRPGLRRLFYEQAVTKNDINGNPDGQTYPIQLLTHLVTTELVPPSEYGRFPYSQGSGNGFGIAAGNTGASAYSGLVATTSSAMACSCWDSGSKLFVAQVNTATGAVKISCINSSGETVWTNTSLTCATGSLRYVAGMTVVGTNLFVALITVAGTTSVIARLSATTGAIAAGDATWRTTSTFSILFSTNSVNCLGAIGTSLVIASNGASTGFIFLVDSTSPPGASYIAFSLHATTTPTNSRVKVCTDGVASIYIIAAVSSAQGQVRKYNLGLQLVWSSSVAGAPNSICYDKREALLVAACTTAPSFRSINIANGALLSAGPDSTYFWNDIESDNQGNLVAARDGAATDNFVGLSSGLGTVWGPSALANATQTGFSVNKGGSGAPTVLGARSVRPLVVAGGEVRTFSEDGPVAILTGDKLSRVARSIQAVQHGQNLYFADGTAYYYYKSSTNQLLTWTATVGTIPFASPVTKAATLIEKWRDRIVIAGFDDHLFYMSKQSDAFNWDFSPATVTSATAVAGTMPSDFGPIRAIVSYSDDTMIWLCDHGTWRLTGDPQDGGVFDVISGSIGGAQSNAWARDPFNQIYFMSNLGYIYKVTPGAQPMRMSQAIDKRLERIDLSANHVSMIWDLEMQGLYVFVTPHDPLEQPTNYFWEERTNSWNADTFKQKGHQPFAVHTLDGDLPDDRRILLGGRDGHIRMIESGAGDDDGKVIESYVWLTPLTSKQFDEVMLETMQPIFGIQSGDVNWAVHVGRTVEEAFESSASLTGTWKAGRNTVTPIRLSGFAIFVKLTATSPFSVERIVTKYKSLGVVRRRN